jgi:hypothetical protein
MAKRFIDTDLFKKGFLRTLKSKYKLLWVYLLNDCNHAGVWEVELDIASLRLGCTYEKEETLANIGDKIVILDNGNKWFIPSFIEFQYGPELAKTNNVFKSIDSILTKFNLYQHVNIEITETGTTIHSFRSRLSQKTKDRVFLEAEFICQYCSEQKSKSELVIDHFVPLYKGGNNEDWNLVCSCIKCNSHKTDLLPDDFLGRKHTFLKPTAKILERLSGYLSSLKGANKKLIPPKDTDKDKDILGGVGENELMMKRAAFEIFWKQYVKQENEEEAWDEWQMLTPEEIDKELWLALPMHLANHRQMKAENRYRYIPQAYTWLKEKRWKTPVDVAAKPEANGRSSNGQAAANYKPDYHKKHPKAK